MKNWYQKMKKMIATVRSCNHVRLPYSVQNTSQTKPSVREIRCPFIDISNDCLKFQVPFIWFTSHVAENLGYSCIEEIKVSRSLYRCSDIKWQDHRDF
jgi:hypothetical protein